MKVTGRSHRSNVFLLHQAALMTAVPACFFFLCSSLKSLVRMGPRPLRCATRSSSSTASSSCASTSPTRSCSNSSTTTCSSSSKRSISARALNGLLLTSAWTSSRLSICSRRYHPAKADRRARSPRKLGISSNSTLETCPTLCSCLVCLLDRTLTLLPTVTFSLEHYPFFFASHRVNRKVERFVYAR